MTESESIAVNILAFLRRGPKGDLRVAISSNGRVVSNLDVDIKCNASGTIIKLPCDVSDAVKQGDLLCELDPVDQERTGKYFLTQTLRQEPVEVLAGVHQIV